jgi:hypothetical protein
LFIQCLECHTFFAQRNQHFHDCINALAAHKKATSSDEDRESLLYKYGDGLPADRFAATFAHCTSCGKFMTKNASLGHNCKEMKQLVEEEW